MVAELRPVYLPAPGVDNQKPISYRDVLLSQPHNKRSSQEFSVPSLVVGKDGPQEGVIGTWKWRTRTMMTDRIDRKQK